LILSCLAKSPAERPASAAELEARLSACPDSAPWTAEASRGWWLRLDAKRPARNQPSVLSGTALTIDVQRHGQADA
jgi:hypothetical protein